MILRNIITAASALALTACAVGPNYAEPKSASAPTATGSFVSANSAAVTLAPVASARILVGTVRARVETDQQPDPALQRGFPQSQGDLAGVGPAKVAEHHGGPGRQARRRLPRAGRPDGIGEEQ